MLEGVRVIDLTWVLGGPFAGQLLAQLGADVIKVEPLEGESARSIPPYFVGEDSTFFLSVNRGKKSLGLDLRSEAGRQVFYDLVRESDAVMYGFRADVPQKLGIDHASLKAVNPRVCVAQLIGIHDDSEHAQIPAFDLVVQALSGLMSLTGEADRPPVRVGYQVADLAGGAYLALAVAAALHQAARTGEGVHTQVSLLDTQLSMLTWQAQNYFATGESPEAQGSRHHMIAPSEAFRGSDGRYFVISPTGEKFWQLFCAAIERDDLADHPKFALAADRIANVAELSKVLQEHFLAKPSEDWVNALSTAGVPAAKVLTVAEALDQPAAHRRAMVEDLTEPHTGEEVRFLGNPFKRPRHSLPPLTYPPRVGADTSDVLGSVCGYSPEQIENLADAGVIRVGASDDNESS